MKIFNFIDNINKENLQECIKDLNNGKSVVLPTDTVYGIAADATNVDAVKKLYKIKNRNEENPINVLVSSKDMAKKCAKNFNHIANRLTDKFWPGPLTIVVEKNYYVPDIVTANKNTIGIRMPENEITLKIIEALQKPLAVPSANLSGRPSGTCIKDIIKDFGDNIDCYIDYGVSKIGIESTIVKINDENVNILRKGKITKDEIEALGIKVVETNKENKFKHYKIDVECKLVYNVDNLINEEIIKNNNKKIAIIAFCEDLKYIKKNKNISIYDLKSKNDLGYAMKNIYKILREIEAKKYEICLICMPNKENKTESIINIFEEMCK